MVGTSRKSTIGKVLGDLGPDERLEGTAATVAIAIANGADIVRVHDVREMARVAKMADAICAGRGIPILSKRTSGVGSGITASCQSGKGFLRNNPHSGPFRH